VIDVTKYEEDSTYFAHANACAYNFFPMNTVQFDRAAVLQTPSETGKNVTWRVFPMGDCCLLIEFGRQVDPEINRLVRATAEHFLANPLPGVVDVVPAFSSLAIHYRPELIEQQQSAPYHYLQQLIEQRLSQGLAQWKSNCRVVEIPVCYGRSFGPDLAEVALTCKMSEEEVIQRHSSSNTVIYMLGFAPGLPYAGGLDPLLSMPRRSTPRKVVEEGTVAIANEQTAIYSIQSPGGWNLIGRTPTKLFDPGADSPCLLRPGDRLKFIPISPEQFLALWAER
jgi:inhibitor of KinA